MHKAYSSAIANVERRLAQLGVRGLRPVTGRGVMMTMGALPATPQNLERLSAAWSFDDGCQPDATGEIELPTMHEGAAAQE
ncbi:MAG: hypothetical protein ACI9MR_003451 [Myxococcota bacterium]|jgi:hypothetical protein